MSMVHNKNCVNIAENFNRLSRVHERYRQTTDGRTTTYSERERKFTFAKNWADNDRHDIRHSLDSVSSRLFWLNRR